MGPVTTGATYVEDFRNRMLIAKFKVANFSDVAEDDIPFGVSVRIEPGNVAESQGTVLICPTLGSGTTFGKRVRYRKNPTKEICRMRIEEQVVPVRKSEACPEATAVVASGVVVITPKGAWPPYWWKTVTITDLAAVPAFTNKAVTKFSSSNERFIGTVTGVANGTYTVSVAVSVLESVTYPIIDTAALWDFDLIPIDHVHSLLQAQYVEEVNDAVSGVWDEYLAQDLEGTSELVHKDVAQEAGDFPSALTNTAGSNYEFVEYENVNCNWYVKRTVKLVDGMTRTYWTNEPYSWPAVLVQGPEFAEIDGNNDGNDYIAKIVVHDELRERVDGPTKTKVEVTWKAAATEAATAGVQQMHPTSIRYQGIYFNWPLDECLHPEITSPTEVVGNPGYHPVFSDNQIRGPKSYDATVLTTTGGLAVTCTDWPESLVGEIVPIDHLGGVVIVKKTYYRPNVATS